MPSEKIDIVYWKDKIKGELERKTIEIEPFGFQLSSIAEWKMLISAKDVEVVESKVCVIDVQETAIPKNAIISILPVMRHALGLVLDVFGPDGLKKIEEEKKISQTVFLPISNGTVKKGELIGVINVQYVKTSALSKISEMISKWVEGAKWAEDVGGIRLD
ncbi:MAG: DUF22 domain-containing protein [Archaeoglobus sp.]|nr:DUF22 domain-containing protein [Archaeoglobus sp.]